MIRINKKLDTLVLLQTDIYREERFDPELWPKNSFGLLLHYTNCYWDDNEKLVKAITDVELLEEAKEIKTKEIDSAFNNEVSTGHFMSTTLEIEIDCRRSTTKNDLQNVQGLMSYMVRNGITTTDYRGVSKTKSNVTISQLTDICGEMEDHVLGLYNKKWILEAQINACTNKEQLDAIKW